MTTKFWYFKVLTIISYILLLPILLLAIVCGLLRFQKSVLIVETNVKAMHLHLCLELIDSQNIVQAWIQRILCSG